MITINVDVWGRGADVSQNATDVSSNPSFPWIDTQVAVHKGDRITFISSEDGIRWHHNSLDSIDASGKILSGNYHGAPHLYDFGGIDDRNMELIACIIDRDSPGYVNNGKFTYYPDAYVFRVHPTIGTLTNTHTMQRSGNLFLATNDVDNNLPNFFTDNDGDFSVTMSIEPVCDGSPDCSTGGYAGRDAATTSDPISLHLGEKRETVTDIRIPVGTIELNFTRYYYQNRRADPDFRRPLGAGWTHNHAIKIRTLINAQNKDTVTMATSVGSDMTFYRVNAESLSSPSDEKIYLRTGKGANATAVYDPNGDTNSIYMGVFAYSLEKDHEQL
jgi:hypothetical protein